MSGIQQFEAFCDRLASLYLRQWLVVLFSFALLFLLFLTDLGADRDLFARVAVGKLVWTQAEVSTVDPFAFTPKLPQWIDHEWLSGVVFYFTAVSFGDLGLFLLKLGAALLTLGLLLAASSRGERVANALFFSFCSVNCVAVWQSTVRAQVFTYLCYAYLLYVLTQKERRGSSRLLYTIPLLFIFWVNAHGGVALGLILLGIFALQDLLKLKLLLPIISLLSLAALMLNPYGIDLLTYLFSALSMERPSITEWAPRPFFSLSAVMINISLLLLLWSVYLKRSLFTPFELLLFACSFYAAYKHNRLSPFLFMNLIVFGDRAFELVLSEIKSRLARLYKMTARMLALSATLLLCVAAFQLIKFAGTLNRFELNYSVYPTKAVEWLYTNAAGKLLVDFNTGSFALWRLYPKYQVSLDGRYEELYSEDVVASVSKALSGSRADLERINPDFILLPQATLSVDQFGADWLEVYSDSSWRVFAKNGTKFESNEVTTVRPIWD